MPCRCVFRSLYSPVSVSTVTGRARACARTLLDHASGMLGALAFIYHCLRFIHLPLPLHSLVHRTCTDFEFFQMLNRAYSLGSLSLASLPPVISYSQRMGLPAGQEANWPRCVNKQMEHRGALPQIRRHRRGPLASICWACRWDKRAQDTRRKHERLLPIPRGLLESGVAARQVGHLCPGSCVRMTGVDAVILLDKPREHVLFPYFA